MADVFVTKKKAISWALVDLGNVLIEADAKPAYDILINQHKLSEKLVKEFLIGTPEHNQFCRGKITSDEYYQVLLNYLQPDVNEQKQLTLEKILLALDSAILEHNPKVLELIKKLKLQGIKIAIVTDTHEWQSVFFRNRIDFDKYADRVFESHKVGKLKSDPGYFENICKELQETGEHMLLIDDNPTNNKMAQQIGVFAPGYTNYEQFAPFLEEIEITVSVKIKAYTKKLEDMIKNMQQNSSKKLDPLLPYGMMPDTDVLDTLQQECFALTGNYGLFLHYASAMFDAAGYRFYTEMPRKILQIDDKPVYYLGARLRDDVKKQELQKRQNANKQLIQQLFGDVVRSPLVDVKPNIPGIFVDRVAVLCNLFAYKLHKQAAGLSLEKTKKYLTDPKQLPVDRFPKLQDQAKITSPSPKAFVAFSRHFARSVPYLNMQRTVPLYNTVRKCLATTDTIEKFYIYPNALPYFPEHFLGVSLERDNTGFVDFEAILMQYYLFGNNVVISQNLRHSSSMPGTFHTHIFRNPGKFIYFSEQLNSHNFVTVGANKDSGFFKFYLDLTQEANISHYAAWFQSRYLDIMEQYGGIENVDILFVVLHDGTNDSAIFMPFKQIIAKDLDNDIAIDVGRFTTISSDNFAKFEAQHGDRLEYKDHLQHLNNIFTLKAVPGIVDFMASKPFVTLQKALDSKRKAF